MYNWRFLVLLESGFSALHSPVGINKLLFYCPVKTHETQVMFFAGWTQTAAWGNEILMIWCETKSHVSVMTGGCRLCVGEVCLQCKAAGCDTWTVTWFEDNRSADDLCEAISQSRRVKRRQTRCASCVTVKQMQSDPDRIAASAQTW